MAEFDTADLVESIRTRGQIPTAGDWTDAKLLTMATEELRTSIVPSVLSVREGYYDETVDLPFSSNLFRIPHWAVGQKLAGVYYVPVSTSSSPQPIPLDQLSDKLVQNTWTQDSMPRFFVLRGNRIQVYPAPSTGATGSVRMKFQARPSALVLPAACAVNGLNTNLGATVNDGGLVNAARVDVVQPNPGFECVLRNFIFNSGSHLITSDTYSSGSLLDTQLFDGSGVAIYPQKPTIVPTGQTCYPQCPTEFWYILAQTVAVKYLENQGFIDELVTAQRTLAKLVEAATPVITPRGGEDTKRFFNNRLFPRGGG